MPDDADPDALRKPPPPILANRYRLGAVIGRGGMSTVYRADDTVLGRPVAVKVLSKQDADPSAIRRERSEVAVLASLGHHALVTLYDADIAVIDGDERGYLVMELVDGPALDDRIAQGPIAPADFERMATDLVEALLVVHDRGVVHRDIKPANILLSPSVVPGREFSAKLADFGIATLVDATRATATGTVIGTAAYLSPEQAQGQKAGPAADIYSLGLVLLEAATGRREFPGTMIESLTARLGRDPQVPGSLGYGWKSLLTAMTARDPDARPTAREVLARIGRSSDPGVTMAGGDAPVAGDTGLATAVLVPPPGPGATSVQNGADATEVLEDASTSPSRDRPERTRVLSVQAPSRSAGRRRWVPLLIGLVVAAAIVVGVVVAIAHGRGGHQPSPVTSPPASSVPTSGDSPNPTATSTPAVTTTPAPAVTPPVATPTVVPTVAPTVSPTVAPAPVPAPGGNGNGNGNGKGKGNGNGNGKNK